MFFWLKSYLRKKLSVMKNLFYIVIFFGWLPFSYGQLYFLNPFENNYFEPHAEIGTRLLVNGSDAFWGFNAGIDDVGFDYNIGVEFAFRPFDKYVYEEVEKNVFYQYDENLRYISLYGGKRFGFIGIADKTEIGLNTGFQLGYLWGNYQGFRKYGKDRGYLSPEISAYYNHQNFYIHLGYSYFKTPSDNQNNMIHLKLSFTLNKNNIN